MRATALLLLGLSLLACRTSRTEPDVFATESAPRPQSTGDAVGSYSEREIDDDGVLSAAREAIRLLRAQENDASMSLLRIRSAQAQVVAGMNYALELEFSSDRGPGARRVVVFHRLDGAYELASTESVD